MQTSPAHSFGAHPVQRQALATAMAFVVALSAMLGVSLAGMPRAEAVTDVAIEGRLVTQDLTPITFAGVSLFHFETTGGYWRPAQGPGAFAQTSDDEGVERGKFTLTIPAADVAGKDWVLVVNPPQNPDAGVPTLGVTMLPLPQLRSAGAGETIALGDAAIAPPDLIGTVTDTNGTSPLDGVYVTVEVSAEIDEFSRTIEAPFGSITQSGGKFAIRRPVPGDFVEALRPFVGPGGTSPSVTLRGRTSFSTEVGSLFVTRPDLVAFTTDLTSFDAAELRAVTAKFPTANIQGTLRLRVDGDPAGDVNFEVEREAQMEVPGGFMTIWQYAGVGGMTRSDGKFAVALPLPTDPAVAHRIQFSSPQGGGPYPAFSVPLTDAAGAPLTGLTTLTPAFPVPDIFGTLSDDAGPVMNGVVTLQKYITDPFGNQRWEWTDDFSPVTALGEFAITASEDLTIGEWRLRVTVFDNNGGEVGFSQPLPDDDTTWLNLALTVPTPNLTGTVRAPIGPDGALVALGDARVELRRYNTTFGFWDWTDLQTSTGNDGTFAMVLPIDERTGELELMIRPTGPLSEALPAFSFALTNLNAVGGLQIDFPLPDLTGIVLDASGDGVANAWVQLERQVTSPFGTFWDWADGFASTAPSGGFALSAPEAAPDAVYRLRITPPFGRAGLVEFTFEVPGPGLSGSFELAFPTPNVGGTVLDPDGDAVAGAWVTLQAWDETGGYWEWLTSADTRASSGAFALYVDPATVADRDIRLDVRSPGDRDDLVPFQVDVTFAADGTAEFPGLSFPSPNLTVTIMDSGVPVRGAFGWVERITTDGGEQTDLWQSTGLLGMLALRVEDAGDYRLHVHGPWGGDLPTFQRDFSVTGDGTVTGVVTGSTLTFPAPNLTIDVNDANGDPIRFAHLELRRYDATTQEWVWVPQNGTADRNGIAKLAVEPGQYRIYVHPPWYASDLAIGLVELTVPVSGDVTGIVALSGPNVDGTLTLGTGSTGWAWIEVTPTDSSAPPVPGAGVAATGSSAGTFGLNLADGEYVLTVWPAQGSTATTPLEVVVTVTGGALDAWRFTVQAPGADNCPASGTCTLDLSFADPLLAANLDGTVTRDGTAVEGAFITAIATGAGTSGTPAGWRGSAVTDASGVFGLRIPTDISVELFVAIADGGAVLVGELPGTRDATSGTGPTLEVGAILRELGASPSTPTP